MKWADKLARGNWSVASWTSHGNYQKFTCEGHERVLMIGFDHERNAKPLSDWEPWGSTYAINNNFHYIGYSTHINDWYLGDWIREDIGRIAGDLSRYDKVLMTGVSMGGYAALALSALIPGSYVAAFSPQSSLDPDRVNFDERFPEALRLDWDQSNADLAALQRDPSNCYVFYDPRSREEAAHAARIPQHSTSHRRTKFAGHASMLYLNKMGILHEVVDRILKDDLSVQTYYRLLRNRRVMRWYYNEVKAYYQDKDREEMLGKLYHAYRANLDAVTENRNKPGAKNVL